MGENDLESIVVLEENSKVPDSVYNQVVYYNEDQSIGFENVIVKKRKQVVY